MAFPEQSKQVLFEWHNHKYKGRIIALYTFMEYVLIRNADRYIIYETRKFGVMHIFKYQIGYLRGII